MGVLNILTGKNIGAKSSGGGTRPKPMSAGARGAVNTRTRPQQPLKERSDATGQMKGNVKKSGSVADATLMKKNAEMSAKVTELESTVVDIEKERDFYFQKLRDIEVMMQVHQETEGSDAGALIDKVFKVLYATAEDNVVVTDDGVVSVLFLTFLFLKENWKFRHSQISACLPTIQLIDKDEQELENALFE